MTAIPEVKIDIARIIFPAVFVIMVFTFNVFRNIAVSICDPAMATIWLYIEIRVSISEMVHQPSRAPESTRRIQKIARVFCKSTLSSKMCPAVEVTWP